MQVQIYIAKRRMMIKVSKDEEGKGSSFNVGIFNSTEGYLPFYFIFQIIRKSKGGVFLKCNYWLLNIISMFYTPTFRVLDTFLGLIHRLLIIKFMVKVPSKSNDKLSLVFGSSASSVSKRKKY